MKQRLVIFLIISLSSLFWGCKDKNDNYGVSYRPDNFPEILIPMDGAIETRYLSPETGRIVEGTYSITFWMDEEYPAPNTIEEIQSYLKKQGCVRVVWTADDFYVYNVVEEDAFGNRTAVENAQATQDFRENLKKTKKSDETLWQRPNPRADYADVIYSTWHEEWVSPHDELITVILQCNLPGKGNGEMLLYVTLSDSTPSSRRYQYVKKYKERHPEQFEVKNDIETKSPGDELGL